MAEMAENDDDDDDDDDHSPSAGSAASLELYQSVRGLIPDGRVRDKDQISMKSDCAAGMRRRLSVLNMQEHKVTAVSQCNKRQRNTARLVVIAGVREYSFLAKESVFSFRSGLQ